MKRIAAIITVFFRGSHADVIVPKFVHGFPTDDGLLAPRVEVVSLYIDQFPERDVGRAFAAEHDIPIYDSISAALKRGGDELDVDGVLLIGEHGDYAWNEKQQQLFPRRYFMEQICGVMATSGRAVPVFNDKHLSYNWHDARWMYDRARALGAPFMAGSSLPVAWRNPWLEHEMDTELEEAVAIVSKPSGSMEEHCDHPALFSVEYRDGFRGSVLMLNGYVTDLAYACRETDGEISATEFHCQGHGPGGPHAHFSYLGLNIEEMFLSGTASYPVERTLLTSGVLEAALTSRHEGYRRIQTDWLDVECRSYERLRWRPTAPRPGGACLDAWPPTRNLAKEQA